MIDTILSNKKRLLIGGWILGAVIILAYNGITLKTMLTPPDVKQPGIIKMLTQKSDQLRTLEMENNKLPSAAFNLDPFISRLQNLQIKKEISNILEEQEKRDIPSETPDLPRLTGILHITDIGERSRIYAVIDGQKLGEKEKIQGYTVHRISRKGVVLTKTGKQWFLKAPENNYSLEKN